jgi:hypothetical protein
MRCNFAPLRHGGIDKLATHSSVTRTLSGGGGHPAAGRRPQAQLFELIDHGRPFLALDGGVVLCLALQPRPDCFQTLIRWFHG